MGNSLFLYKIIQNLSHVSYNLSVVLMNFDTKKSVIYRILSFVTLLFMNRFFVSEEILFCFHLSRRLLTGHYIVSVRYWQLIKAKVTGIHSVNKVSHKYLDMLNLQVDIRKHFKKIDKVNISHCVDKSYSSFDKVENFKKSVEPQNLLQKIISNFYRKKLTSLK